MFTNLKKTVLLSATAALFLAGTGLDAAPKPKKGSAKMQKVDVSKIGSSHPRLFITPETSGVIRKNAKTFYGKPLSERIIHDADLLLTMPPIKRVISYKQMLFTSRKVAGTVQHLAVAYMLTGKKEYAERAIKELEHAADFPDWNPYHFLDTAEMTFALAIGYDWFYHLLTPEQRQKFTTAIIEKGLKPSFTGNLWWMKMASNWNPVCHSGLVAGAIAVADIDPELSQKVIARAVECVPYYIRKGYHPNGAYAEGPGYWSYGTLYLCYLIGMLNNSFDTDFGLSADPGFSHTGEYAQAMTSPRGYWFNHADGGMYRGVSFEMTFLAHHFKRPEFFDRTERKLVLTYAKVRPDKPLSGMSQHVPLLMVYMNLPEEKDLKGALSYFSGNEAENPVAVMRSGHKVNSSWLAVKGGTGNTLHGHMDAGTFCFETNGVRWADDLGGDLYGVLEEKGISLWYYGQNSTRWNVFRYGVQSHNTLHINGHRQNVNAKATFRKVTDTEAVIDLSGTYKFDAKKAIRTFNLLPDGGMKVTDSLAGLKPGSKVKWQLCTFAKCEEREDGTMLLRRNGRRLVLRKTSDAPWLIQTDDELRNKDLDSPNRGMVLISFTAIAPADGNLDFSVTMTAESPSATSAPGRKPVRPKIKPHSKMPVE